MVVALGVAKSVHTKSPVAQDILLGLKKVVKEVAEDQKLKTLCGKANCNILFVLNKEKRSNVSVNPQLPVHIKNNNSKINNLAGFSGQLSCGSGSF